MSLAEVSAGVSYTPPAIHREAVLVVFSWSLFAGDGNDLARLHVIAGRQQCTLSEFGEIMCRFGTVSEHFFPKRRQFHDIWFSHGILIPLEPVIRANFVSRTCQLSKLSDNKGGGNVSIRLPGRTMPLPGQSYARDPCHVSVYSLKRRAKRAFSSVLKAMHIEPKFDSLRSTLHTLK